MNKELPKVLEELSKINEEKSYVSFQDVALKVKEYGLTNHWHRPVKRI